VFTASLLQLAAATTLLALLEIVIAAPVSRAKRDDSFLLLSAFPIAYIYALTPAGAFTFYPWYYAPIHAFLSILAAVGIDGLARRAGRAAWVSATSIASVLVVGQLIAALTVRVPPRRADDFPSL
jgi:hypothetical protein